MDQPQNKPRIHEFIDAVMKVSRGEYDVQLELSEENNDLDALAMGINMMVDDIKAGHVFEQENDRIKILNKQLEEAKAKAEESDRLKSAFLANMSHEIRTPMNGILGFAELLKKQDLSGEEQREYIKIIEKSGNRMLNIINDIIDISKIEANLMEVSVSETNINQQLDYIHHFFIPEAKEKGLRFFTKNDLKNQDILILTDKEKLYAILINLVKNAIKYTNEGSIEFGYQIKTIDDSKVLEFFVKDTGVGIPINRKKAIFDRFVQADIEDKNAAHGAGLGLAITNAYIALLGGKIWLKDNEDKGSTFYFTIPYKTKTIIDSNKSLQTNKDMEKSKGLMKMLIVEDDPISERLISAMVKPFAKEILTAQTGLTAVNICRDHSDIDIIFMDVKMPEMSGYEATKIIREFNKDVVIIMQTAYGLVGDEEKAIEAGCNNYITKPIIRKKLADLIQYYIDKKVMETITF